MFSNVVMTLYKKLWLPTVGRPWTYAIRQTAGWKIFPVVGGIVGTLVVIAPVAPVAATLLGVGGGFLAGHLWWDTKGKYIKHKEYFEKHDEVSW